MSDKKIEFFGIIHHNDEFIEQRELNYFNQTLNLHGLKQFWNYYELSKTESIEFLRNFCNGDYLA